MQNKRHRSAIVLLAVVAIAIAACAGQARPVTPVPARSISVAGTIDSSRAPLPTQEAVLSRSAAAPAASGDHYVGLVSPSLTSPFAMAVVAGATARAQELGWGLDVQAPAIADDAAAFDTTVSQLLAKGVRAISIGPLGTDAGLTAVKVANASATPILVHNSITPFTEGDVASYIGFDQWGGAEKLAGYTCELIGKKYGTTPAKANGKVFVLLGGDSFASHRRTGGFKAGLAKGCPKVTIAGEEAADWLRAKGSEVATSALQQAPDIDAFFGNNDEMAIGAALAAEQLGLTINQDFFAVSIDGSQPALDLLKQGKFAATLAVDPARMGATIIDTMERVLNGVKAPQIILTPSVVVSSDNLNDYLAGKLWTAPVSGSPELDNGKPTIP